MPKSLADLAKINPQVPLPRGAVKSMVVSFIPMSDVSEAGDWFGHQVRALGEVRNGFTAFMDGDVLVAKITPCFENGKGAQVSGLVNGIGFGSTEFHVLRAVDGVSPRFIHHLVQSSRLRRKAETQMSGSAGQRRVPSRFFETYEVPDFGQAEQVEIARVLDTLNATIRQTEAIIEKLKQVKQGLLHALLTRGIDANGELRPPQSQAPHLYQESPLEWIPKAWSATIIDRLVDQRRPVVYGILMPGQGYADGIPVVKVKDINGGRIDEGGLLLTSPAIDREYKRSRLAEGDLLFTIRGTVGRTAFVPASLSGANITQDTARLAINGTDARFVRDYFSMTVPSRFVAAHTLGVAVQGINLRDVRRIPVPRPSLDEAVEISNRLEAVDIRIESELAAMGKLRTARHGVMDDLLTGHVRIAPLLDAAPA